MVTVARGLRPPVFIGTDPVTGNARQVSRTFRATKKQANSAPAALVTELASGGAPLQRSATLDESRWLDHITSTRSPTTVRGYRLKVNRISPNLGQVRLEKLTAQQLDRAYR